MTDYACKVHMKQGGDELVIESGGKITAGGVQASAITNATAASGGDSPTEAEHNAVVTKLNSVLAALRGVGIIAP
ncbi:MAG: hypothetical protein KJ067_07340 [Vicinamibacteria bacterium]|nr:hypothetical protein [Vicinamibacteria bacterium]